MTNESPKKSEAEAQGPDELGRRASDRSNCYGLLALIFRDVPTSRVVARLRSGPLAGVLSDLGCDPAEHLAGRLEVVTERLREEYTRVFVGPGLHVSPYASVHHDDERRLWGDSTVRVKRFIEATGLSFAGDSDSIPDHIAIEFELMQRLIAHEAGLWRQRASAPARRRDSAGERLRRCLQAEEEFLRDHLSAWLPRFCDRVSETGPGLFYEQMASLAKSVVRFDLELIAEARRALSPESFAGARQSDEAPRSEGDLGNRSIPEEAT